MANQKSAVNRGLAVLGVELKRVRETPPATPARPVGDLVSVMQDMAKRGFQPRHIVDIGANRGNWSREVSGVFPEAKFFLFEPIPGFEAELAAFVAQRPGSRLWMAAASSAEGSTDIEFVTTLAGELTSGSTLAGGKHDPAKYRVERLSVPTVTLDGLVSRKELPTPDLLKIDVEGFELHVLAGAATVLGAVEAVILEVSFERFWNQPVFHEVVAHMAERGFWVYDFVGFNRRPADGSLGQADVCFVRTGSKLRRLGGWDD